MKTRVPAGGVTTKKKMNALAHKSDGEFRGRFLATAKSYAKRGWVIVPMNPNGAPKKYMKAPLWTLLPRKLESASGDSSVLESWWRQWPYANVGIATGRPSGVYVIDVDCHSEARNGIRSIRETVGRLPETLCERTPSGGLHLFYSWNVGDPPTVSSCHFADLPGVEYKGTGSWCTVAPSVVCDRCYRVENPGAAIAEMPDSLKQRVLAIEQKRKCGCLATHGSNGTIRPMPISVGDVSSRAASYLANVPAAVAGEDGHVQLLKAATALVVGFLIPRETAFAMLQEYNMRCVPPWTERELVHKIDEAGENKLGKPLGWLL